MTRVLVIGATGTVGREVVAQLAEAGATVRAMTRNPATAFPRRGVEVAAGDLTAPESLDGCLEGVDRVFVVWTAPAATIEAAFARITGRARRVVLLTSPAPAAHPLFSQPNPMKEMHDRLERAAHAPGVERTILRPGMFASNARDWWGPAIRAGGPVRWPYLDVPTAPIDPRDIAAAAVRTLLENGHAEKEYVLTGPESVTQREQIETIARAAGRTVTAEGISEEEAVAELGFPPPAIRMLLKAWAAATGRPALVTPAVAELTGRPARTLFEWATDHAEDFGAAVLEPRRDGELQIDGLAFDDTGTGGLAPESGVEDALAEDAGREERRSAGEGEGIPVAGAEVAEAEAAGVVAGRAEIVQPRHVVVAVGPQEHDLCAGAVLDLSGDAVGIRGEDDAEGRRSRSEVHGATGDVGVAQEDGLEITAGQECGQANAVAEGVDVMDADAAIAVLRPSGEARAGGGSQLDLDRRTALHGEAVDGDVERERGMDAHLQVVLVAIGHGHQERAAQGDAVYLEVGIDGPGARGDGLELEGPALVRLHGGPWPAE